jgi:hypothetical protein
VQLTGVLPTGKLLPDAGVHVTAGAGSTLSLAVTAKFTVAPFELVASAVIGAGTVIVGGVVSWMVTVKVAFAALLAASWAEQLTLVFPSGNIEPEAGVHATATAPSTRSVAVAVKFTVAPFELVASAVIGAGTVITGGVVSWTVTVKVALAALLAASWAEQLTVVLPTGNIDPEARVHATGTEPSTRSVAVTVKLTVAPFGPVADAVTGAGTVIVGGVVSRTMT